MKLVAWIGEEECHKAIACKLHLNTGLVGLVIERKTPFLKNLSAGILFEKAIENLAVSHIKSSWNGMQQYYRSNFPRYPEVQTLYCESIDDPEVTGFTNQLAPDLVLLSGLEVHVPKTIEPKLRIGYIELHNGLSPYVNAGMNSTNWCISNKAFHLLGNAILWLRSDQKTPDIFSSETAHFEGNEPLRDIYIRIMEHGHDLCQRSIRMISEGRLFSYKQEELDDADLTTGKNWGFAEKQNLLKGLAAFSKEVNNAETKRLREKLTLFSLRK